MTVIADSEENALDLAVQRWDWDDYAEYCRESFTGKGKGDIYAELITSN